MKDEYYTPDGMHPEDAITKAKTFINELQQVQETYFNKLVSDLNLSKNGEDWLFDYIYNTPEKEYDGFEHYLQEFRQKYENLVSSSDIMYNSSYPSVDLLTSCEASLATSFPSYFDSEQVSSELETFAVNDSIILKDSD